mgnify:CR=1 FL=1
MEALIVAAAASSQNAVAEVVRYTDKFNIVTVSTCSAARRIASERTFDMVIINAQPDPEWKQTAEAIAGRYEGGVIYIEQAVLCEETTAELEAYGIIVISKPLSRTALYNAVKIVYATNMRIAGLRDENRDLQRKIDDMRIITRAKLILIQTLGYTEQQAHKYIERKAMDTRTSKARVASDILKTYER